MTTTATSWYAITAVLLTPSDGGAAAGGAIDRGVATAGDGAVLVQRNKLRLQHIPAALCSMVDEFVGSDGSDGCWMWPYFREIRKLLNHPERRYDKDIRKWTNTHMIEMVSELYYRAIRGVAEDILTDCE